MAETLGSLVDKLTIANIRLWHLEDARRDRTLSDKERLAAADAISVVNKQRNDLIDEIDEFLYKAAHGQVKLKEPKVKIYKKFWFSPEEEKLSEELARSVDRRRKGGRAKKSKSAASSQPQPRKKAALRPAKGKAVKEARKKD